MEHQVPLLQLEQELERISALVTEPGWAERV